MSIQSLSTAATGFVDMNAIGGESLVLGVYDGNVVALKMIENKTMTIEKREIIELNIVRILNYC